MTRERPMRRKHWKKKLSNQYQLESMYSSSDRCLIELEKSFQYAPEYAEETKSLLLQFMLRQSWTVSQWNLVRIICKLSRAARLEKRSELRLYAISDGIGNVKIGYSRNVGNRLKTMQTGTANDLRIEWNLELGRCSEMSARHAESRLHRYCKKYHVKGEWYKAECMTKVRSFRYDVIQDKQTPQEEEAELRMAL